jgi:EmrB/QacA subfamily drug resistance transporter
VWLWTLVVGSLTSFLVGLDALVVTTALPTLHEEFGADVASLSWTINAYALAFAASILTGSAVGDRFGKRRVFVIGLIIFTAASAWCALSPTAEMLIAARAVQGIGGGIAVPLALALITEATPAHSRGKAFGIWGAITGIAVAAGPLVGGAIVEGIAWQWVFWLNVPVGIAVALFATWKIRHGERVFRSADPVGLLIATVGVFGVAQALIRGDGVGWSHWSIGAGLVGGPLALALFVVWERRSPSPMMPLKLFRNRTLTGGCIASFVLMAGVFGLGFLTAQYLQLALHYEPFGVGLRLLPATGMALVISPIAGRLADRIGEAAPIAAGLALLAAGLILIGLLVNSTSGYGTVLGPLFVAGIGIAIAFPTVATAVMRSTDPEMVGVASGVSNTFRQVGAVFGVAIATAIFAGKGGYTTPSEFVDGLSPAFIVLGVWSEPPWQSLRCANGSRRAAMRPRQHQVPSRLQRSRDFTAREPLAICARASVRGARRSARTSAPKQDPPSAQPIGGSGWLVTGCDLCGLFTFRGVVGV